MPPLSKTPRPVQLPKDTRKWEALLEEVQSMLEKGAIETVEDPDPGFYSHLFVVTKKSGGLRPVIDLKALNQHLSVPHFKMETAQSIRGQIQLGESAISLDMKDAYFHVPVHEKYRKYMRFAIGDQVYQFKAMCFGLAPAPLIFTKLLRPLAEYLRKKGILIHFYLDDWLIRARCKRLLRSQAQMVLGLAKSLGIIINLAKSNLNPRSRFDHLGIDFDLDQGLVFPTAESLKKIRVWTKFLRQYRKVTAKGFLSLLGLLNHACDMIPLGRLHLRPLQFYLKCFWKAHKDSPFAVIELDAVFFQALSWWEDARNLTKGAPLHLEEASVTIMTDASHARWGGHLGVQDVSHAWSREEASLHINLLEMKAVIRTLAHFARQIRGKSVLVMSDNTTVVSYIKRQGGTHSLSLYRLTRELFQWASLHQVTLHVKYIPGRLNARADLLSRKGQIIKAEWSLSRQVFRQILVLFPWLQVDLFATQLNNQLPCYVSPFPDPAAWKTDALSFSWQGLKAYAFPPISIVSQVIEKVLNTDCVILLVAPYWPSQPWFPVMLSLLVEYPIRLTPTKKLLSQPKSNVFHTRPETLDLHVWTLSRVDSYQKDFQRRSRQWPPNLRESLLCQYTNHIMPHSVIGVLKGVSVWSLSLSRL